MAKGLGQICCRTVAALLLITLISSIPIRAMSSHVTRCVRAIKGTSSRVNSAIIGKMRYALGAATSASLGAYYIHTNYINTMPKTASDAYDQLCQVESEGGVATDIRTWGIIIGAIKGLDRTKSNMIESAVNKCKQRELVHANTYAVFYHGQSQNIRLLSDIYTYLSEWENQELHPNFVALRFAPEVPAQTPVPLVHAKALGLYDTQGVPKHDSTPEAVKSLLSANFALNGNHFNHNENSCLYWLADYNVNMRQILSDQVLASACTFYGLNYNYMRSLKPLNSSSGSLLQIFISKNQLNRACYVALPDGRSYGDKWVPANTEGFKWENRHRRIRRVFDGSETRSEPLRDSLIEYFCRTNKNFAPFITPSRFLTALKWGILPREVAQAAQMRLVMGRDIVLNPEVVKIYREDLVQQHVLDEYSRQLKSCMHRAILDWLDRAEQGLLPSEVIERIKDKPVYQLVVNPERRERERARLKQELAELDAQNKLRWWHKITQWFAASKR